MGDLRALEHELSLRLPLPDRALAEAVFKALKPEAEVPATDRFSVELRLEGEVLLIRIKARDTSSLRAALNSYMSWLKAVRDSCLVLAGS